MQCRMGCGACCIAPSISSAIPGMPQGKAPGIRCIQLDQHNQCRLFGLPERPAVCREFKPTPALCGESAAVALQQLTLLEAMTS